VSPRRAAHLAWASCLICMLLLLVAVVFTLLSRSAPEGSDFTPAFDITLGFALLAFPVVGAIVVSRLPENSIGGRLRDEVDLDALGSDLRAVVTETVQPRPRLPMASILVTLPGRPRRRKVPGWQD
jgi:hypothetical protein